MWIENMNTVLDDNKKLCLSSGEIIKLNETIAMLFEVENLDHASPATVSRCGMIYVDQDDVLGWKILSEKWLKSIPYAYQNKTYTNFIRQLLRFFIEPCLDFIFEHKDFNKTLEISKLWIFQNFLNIFEALMLKSSKSKAKHNEEIQEYKNKAKATQGSVLQRQLTRMSSIVETSRSPRRQITQRHNKKETLISAEFILSEKDVGKPQKAEILNFFLFALTWSFGCISNEKGRNEFSEFLHKLYSQSLGRGGSTPLDVSQELGEIFHDKNVFSMFYNHDKKMWSN